MARTLKHAATAFIMDLTQPSELGTFCVCIVRDALQNIHYRQCFFSQLNTCNHLGTSGNILSKCMLLYSWKCLIIFLNHIDKSHSASCSNSRHWPQFTINVFIIQFSKLSIHFYKEIRRNLWLSLRQNTFWINNLSKINYHLKYSITPHVPQYTILPGYSKFSCLT